MEEKNCGFVYCAREYENVYEERTEFAYDTLNPENQGDVSHRIFYNIICNTSTILVRKDILEQAGMFDERIRFWQEYELNIRISQITYFYYVNEPLCGYRVDKRDKLRLSNKYSDWKKSVQYINHKHKKLIKDLSVYDRLQRKVMILWDAQNRCKISGLFVRYVFIYLEWFVLAFPVRVKDKLRKDRGLSMHI